jgi:hypothetical protein
MMIHSETDQNREKINLPGSGFLLSVSTKADDEALPITA